MSGPFSTRSGRPRMVSFLLEWIKQIDLDVVFLSFCIHGLVADGILFFRALSLPAWVGLVFFRCAESATFFRSWELAESSSFRWMVSEHPCLRVQIFVAVGVFAAIFFSLEFVCFD